MPANELKPCPRCSSDDIAHRCFSHIVNSAGFAKNGWYCRQCGFGPFVQIVSERDAADVAAAILGHSQEVKRG